MLRNRKNPNRWGQCGKVYCVNASLSKQPLQTESQSQCGPVTVQPSPCSSHRIFAAQTMLELGWGWKEQARLLLQITNLNSNPKQHSVPTRSYLLRTRDTNLFTYKFSALPRLFFLIQKTCRGALWEALVSPVPCSPVSVCKVKLPNPV